MDKGFNERPALRPASGRHPAARHADRTQRHGGHGRNEDIVPVFARTLHFLQAVHASALQLNILTPLPGTPLFEDYQSQGRITDHDWSHYDFRHVVIRPARMTAAQLQAGTDWLYRQFYRLDRILFAHPAIAPDTRPTNGLHHLAAEHDLPLRQHPRTHHRPQPRQLKGTRTLILR